MNKDTSQQDGAANRDPITGEPGAHPVGTGVGAIVGGASAGAATGTVAGPIGTVIGAAVGAVVGGMAGKGVAEAIDPTFEDAYWRDNYGSRPYVEQGSSFDDYGPAYAYGVNSFGRYPGRSFEEVESEISSDWTASRGASSLSWERARQATRDAWNRLSGEAGVVDVSPDLSSGLPRSFGNTSSQAQTPLPGPCPIPPQSPAGIPPPPSLPTQTPPEIREPEQPGEHIPIRAQLGLTAPRSDPQVNRSHQRGAEWPGTATDRRGTH